MTADLEVTRRPGSWFGRHRTAVAVTTQLVVLVLVVWFLVIPQMGDTGQSMAVLRRFSGRWIALALLAEVASLYAYTLATRAIVPPRTRPRWNVVARIDLSAIALGHSLPDGGAAGTALAIRLLTTAGVPAADAGVAKIVEGVASMVVLHATVLIGLGYVGAHAALTRWALLPAVVAAGFILVSAVVALALTHPRLQALLVRGLRHIPRVGDRLARTFASLDERDFAAHARDVAGTPKHLAQLLALLATNWVLDALALWSCLHAFGPHVGLQALTVGYALQAISTWVPITPNGLGVAESLMIPMFVALGSHRAVAVDGILAWRLLAYWLPMPLGALAYASLAIHRAIRRE